MNRPPHETDPRLLAALSNLNRIGASINRLGADDLASVDSILGLIAESAIKVVPGSSATIYAYDQARQAFDVTSRVAAGERIAPDGNDSPRPDGLGMRAVKNRRSVLSYEEYGVEIHPVKVRGGARVAACFPLLVADQPVGVLYLDLYQQRQFSQLELMMLDNFVNQAAMAIHFTRQIARRSQALARKEEEAAHLRRAGLLISSRLRLEETLEAILQMALELIDAQYGIFRLVDPGSQQLITRAVAGEGLSQPLVEALPVNADSIMGWVAQNRQPVCIADLQAAPWKASYYPLDPALEMRSELAVPLIGAGNRLEGVLNLESPAVGAFSMDDMHLLQALVTQAVIAIQEVRLLDSLLDVAGRLLTQSTGQVLDQLAGLACDLLNAASSAIWTVTEDRLQLSSSDANYQHDTSLPLDGSLAGQAVLDRRPVTAGNVQVDPRFSRPDLAQAGNWMRALIVPILSGDDRPPVGAFAVYRSGERPVRLAESEWDEKVLTCLSHYAALSIQNAARQDALQAAREQRAVAETFAAVGDIAANLLHHLNNKVGTIPVRVQGIQAKCGDSLASDSYLADNLVEIEHSARQAMDAMRDGLSHLHPIILSPTDISTCVTAAAGDAQFPAAIQLRRDPSLDGLPPVMANQRSLTLVFTNLLDNAAQAIGGRGAITVEGSLTRDGWVKIAVRDNGPGIPSELHDRIFDFDFSGKTSTRLGKLGFGLWWVKTMVVRLGGSISVDSDGEHGSTFWLKLPAADGE